MRNFIIKKVFFFALFLAGLVVNADAQNNIDQRALATKIADVLAKFPSANAVQLEANISAIVDLKENGFAEMVQMIDAPGSGDNTSLEYAISAFSSFASKAENEEHRKMAVRVYSNILDKSSLGFTREFIIRQLQLIGKDDALAPLSKYLSDDQLGEPSARALVQIGSPEAGEILLKALPGSKGKSQIYLVQALGDMCYKPAVTAIEGLLANSDDPMLKKTILTALADIAEPSSAKILQKIAAEAGYNYEFTNAGPAYLNYIKNLNTAHTKDAMKLAGDLVRTSVNNKNVHLRISALQLYVTIAGTKSIPSLFKALNESDPQYTAAALHQLNSFSAPAVNDELIKRLKSVSPVTKTQIIDYLSRNSDNKVLPELYKLYRDKDPDVRLAAIAAIGTIGEGESAQQLLEIMKTGNAEEIKTAKQSLLQLKGDNTTETLKNALKELPAPAQVAALNILGAKAAAGSVNEVFELVNSNDTSVHNAALRALPFVVTSADLEKLFSLLDNSSEKDVAPVQRSVISALAGIKDTAEVIANISDNMKKSAPEKQYRYLKILGTSAGVHAIDEIIQMFEKGKAAVKKESVLALSAISHPQSAQFLLKIFKEAGNSLLAKDAVDGYLNIISSYPFPAEQKILMLQEAVSSAVNVDQRKDIIKQSGDIPLFSSLVFVGEYLGDQNLQQQAAHAVLKIVSSGNELHGEIVRGIITKTIEVLKGQDSDYQKQSLRKTLAEMPAGEGFKSIFNGKDLTGWKGLVANPVERKKMNAVTLKKEQDKANAAMKKGWEVKDGLLIFTGHGDNLATEKMYGDFEMLVDWKITKDGDAGIYLRGTPQVQIWDTARRDVGAQVGSGGLYNNQANPSKPLQVADNAIGEWNNFRIIMKGDKVTVYLNGVLVTDNTVLENYWDRKIPIFSKEQIELQAHGTYVAYRNIYIKELESSSPFVLSKEEKDAGFKVLFDGTDMNEWQGDKASYVIEDRNLVVKPGGGSGGNLFTKQEYDDFIFRFEFQLTPGANNGLGIRAPLEGDAAYTGMELQILDNDADIYKNLKPYQYHGSVYGVIPAKRGYLKKTGEWNTQEVILNGSKIKVILNNEIIVDGDIAEASKNGTPDKLDHLGLSRTKGYIGFLGHGSILRFRNIRVKSL